MNLVLSGPISRPLLAAVERLSGSSIRTPIHEYSWRLEEVDTSLATRREVAAQCATAAVDHAYVKANLRFSDMKLLALDMDSTLITIECIDELADFAGKRLEVAAITEATMRGEIQDFAESLRRRVALLRGLDADVLRRVYEERLRLSAGAETLIAAARANGLYTLLLSGGFTYFAERLKDFLGLDAAKANELETRDGKLTGRVVGSIIDASAKASHVKSAMQSTGSSSAEAIAIGDGSNDILMMQCVEHSVAYHAKTPVVSAASFAITFGGLNTTIDFLS